MSLVRPFKAYRPQPEIANRLATLPYDVMNRIEAAEMARGNPLSFLHVSRAEIDLADSTDPYSSLVYEQAKTNWKRLLADGTVFQEKEPSLYVYRLEWKGRSQTGVVGAFSIDEYERGDIRKHELTRKQKEDDRTRHIVTLGVQTGPVFLAYRDEASIADEISRIMSGSPLYDFTLDDGVTHTLWKAPNPAALVTGFAKVPRLYIADGHHRAASAARARKELKRGDTVLAVAFASSQLSILAYHRVIYDLRGMTHAELLNELNKNFMLSEDVDPSPKKGEFAMRLAGRWYGLKPCKPVTSQDPIERLDVSRLQNEILAPIFGIKDPRTDHRIDFVGGIRGTGELERLVDSGKAALAFSMHPTSIDELFEVSDAGEIMPPKSTWFEPKLRDGLISCEC